jgi:hypothetical protein
MPYWSTPLQQAHWDDRNGDIIYIHQSPDKRDMHKTLCGPGGTHTRPCGDVLAHRMPCVHDSSSIQEKHFPTNQTPPCVQHKDSRADNPSKRPPNCVGTWNRHKRPHISHWEKAQRETSTPWIGRTDLATVCHLLPRGASDWILKPFRGCTGCSHTGVWAYK